jgi:hypothetical protein
MIVKLIPILIVVFLLYLAVRYYKKLSPSEKKPFLIKYAVYAVIAILLLSVITGRIHWLGAVLAGALGLIKVGASTFFRFLPFLKFFQRNNVFGDPKFKTQYLEVTYFVKTGKMTGKVISGEFSGKDVFDLSSDQLDQLEEQLKNQDARSYYLLRVIRQKQFGGQSSGNDFDSSRISEPSIDEAQQILGLSNSYTKKDVDLAYKRLMQKLHPDRGGNDYLASRVNTARDILIKHLDKP